MRAGIGYDAHKLVEGRDLILGGVKIPFERGLLGHSDADVLIHSICDALLGAAGEGDLGKHFPDSDPKFKGISSLLLLKNVKELLGQKGYEVSNMDMTVVCQRPKLSPYIDEMVQNISRAVETPLAFVNIKATTTEGMGFTGSEEGIASYCIAMIRQV
ncbi:MAG: 2-C-methyl-D-erythritol 2,4-cyclodiphosphate synthase [Proteobacteria bacterium]|nr:2-C-methyl-D-erythritol 2,4-cyclodiphosphate synthase [Pseudomonadota bacterium]